MPILVRPVREQLEHDRIIRLLEAKWRRKFKVDANPGDERNVGVKVPVGTLFPDLILTEEGGRKPKALIEVETAESVNHLEAMAQWAHLAKARTSLLLFVPVGAVEAARRLANENAIKLAEVWTYMILGDQVRFTSVFRENGAEPADLIEKVEMFTTERAAPAPRPVPVEPVETPEATAAAEPERPRKLALKAAARAADEAAAAPRVAKLAVKVAAKPAPAAAPPAVRPAAVAKPAAAPAAKPVAKAPAAKVVPPKPAAPAKAAATAAKPAGKAVDKVVARKPAVKADARKAAPSKPAPAKATKPGGVAKKAAPAKQPPRPAARKAAPARPAPRVAAVKKAAPAAKARPSKRK